MDEHQSDSPAQICRHTIVRQEIHIFSKFLNAIRESLTNDQITQNVKPDLEQILAWFIIDYFSHNIDLIEQARKIFWPQSTDDETDEEQSEYVWDPEWFFDYLSIYQLIYQDRQLSLFLLIKFMLQYIHLHWRNTFKLQFILPWKNRKY